jgi:hypothetical protein
MSAGLSLSDKYRVIYLAGRILKARSKIVRLKVRKLFEDLIGRETGGKEIEHVRYANAQAADTGATSALTGVRGYPR